MPKPQDSLVLRVSTALPETATSIDSPGASEGLRGVYGRVADAVEARLRAILTPERLSRRSQRTPKCGLSACECCWTRALPWASCIVGTMVATQRLSKDAQSKGTQAFSQ